MTMSKIVINQEADQNLEEMLAVVNDGFNSGRVKKNEIASWIINHFKSTAFLKQVDSIRSDHFSAIAHLEGVLKKLKATKDSEESLEVSDLLEPVLQRKKRQHKEPFKIDQTQNLKKE